MIRFTLAFVAGVLLFQFQPRLPHPVLFIGYLLPAVCAIPLRWCRLPAWLVLGFAWAHGHAWLSRPPLLPDTLMGEPVVVQGRIDSLVDTNGQRSRFVFLVDHIRLGDTVHQGEWRLRISWYRDAPVLLPGDAWRLPVRLRAVSGYANPGGFDYTHWLYQQGIRYQGTVLRRSDKQRLGATGEAGMDLLRHRLGEAIAATVGGGDDMRSALLQALVVGDRSGFSREDWRIFRATGTNHLVAISGLHIGLVAALVMGLVGGVWRRCPTLCRRWPARNAGAIAGWVVALAYAGLAGFSIPTQRALLMLGVGLLMLQLARRIRLMDALAAVLLVVVCWSPVAVNSASLWLSFCAVAVILWAVDAGPQRGERLLLRWGRAQLAVTIGLFPLLLAWFQQVSLIAPLVNLVVIPLFSLLLVPLLLLATGVWFIWPAAGETGWQGVAWLADGILAGLGAVADWPWASQTFAAPSGLGLGLALLGVALLLGPRGLPGRWLAAVLVLPLMVNRAESPTEGAFHFVLLDVGQGLAGVVRTREHVLVYDAGPRYRSGFNTGDAVLVPYLRRMGIRRIDRLIVSHTDTDHAGGVEALQQHFSIHDVLEGETTNGNPCRAGQGWEWDGVVFRVLHPASSMQGNNASCVIRVENAAGSLLLTGDIEAIAERRMLARGSVEPTTAVVVPHHGSRTSSTDEFIAASRPAYALYPVGRDNRWGFPKADILARWQAIGASRWDSARDGAVEMRFPAEDGRISIRGHRRQHYWNP